jgi:hypothetical protein
VSGEGGVSVKVACVSLKGEAALPNLEGVFSVLVRFLPYHFTTLTRRIMLLKRNVSNECTNVNL